MLAVAGLVVLPAAVELSRRTTAVSLLDAADGIPPAFVLGAVGLGMARRAQRNLDWVRLEGRGSRLAHAAVIVGAAAVALALTAALAVGFYEALLYYQRHH